MKQIFPFLLMLLLCTLTLLLLPTEADAMIYEDTVRLHILANSDSEYDQGLKFKIRDDVLLTYRDVLKECSGEDLSLFGEYTDELEQFVNERLAAYGAPYGAYVTFREEWYDTRDYGAFTLPSGTYLSLVIHLGESAGRNWWCVMYPPLCLNLATDAPVDDAFLGYSESEIDLITSGRYRVKFKTLEVISSLFKK